MSRLASSLLSSAFTYGPDGQQLSLYSLMELWSQLTPLGRKTWISSTHGHQAAGNPSPATASAGGLQDGDLDGSCGSCSVTAPSKVVPCPTGLNTESLKVPARLTVGQPVLSCSGEDVKCLMNIE